jgi:hypothetical protein
MTCGFSLIRKASRLLGTKSKRDDRAPAKDSAGASMPEDAGSVPLYFIVIVALCAFMLAGEFVLILLPPPAPVPITEDPF